LVKNGPKTLIKDLKLKLLEENIGEKMEGRISE
jgi:hypothetical protein